MDEKWSVYIIAIEDSNPAFDALMDLPTLLEWRGLENGLSESEAIDLVSAYPYDS